MDNEDKGKNYSIKVAFLDDKNQKQLYSFTNYEGKKESGTH